MKKNQQWLKGPPEKDDLEVISEVVISHFVDDYNYAYNGYKENTDLLYKLFDLYKLLDIDSYRIYSDNTIIWHRTGSWYNAEEVERMKKLKSFL